MSSKVPPSTLSPQLQVGGWTVLKGSRASSVDDLDNSSASEMDFPTTAKRKTKGLTSPRPTKSSKFSDNNVTPSGSKPSARESLGSSSKVQTGLSSMGISNSGPLARRPPNKDIFLSHPISNTIPRPSQRKLTATTPTKIQPLNRSKLELHNGKTNPGSVHKKGFLSRASRSSSESPPEPVSLINTFIRRSERKESDKVSREGKVRTPGSLREGHNGDLNATIKASPSKRKSVPAKPKVPVPSMAVGDEPIIISSDSDDALLMTRSDRPNKHSRMSGNKQRQQESFLTTADGTIDLRTPSPQAAEVSRTKSTDTNKAQSPSNNGRHPSGSPLQHNGVPVQSRSAPVPSAASPSDSHRSLTDSRNGISMPTNGNSAGSFRPRNSSGRSQVSNTPSKPLSNNTMVQDRHTPSSPEIEVIDLCADSDDAMEVCNILSSNLESPRAGETFTTSSFNDSQHAGVVSDVSRPAVPAHPRKSPNRPSPQEDPLPLPPSSQPSVKSPPSSKLSTNDASKLNGEASSDRHYLDSFTKDPASQETRPLSPGTSQGDVPETSTEPSASTQGDLHKNLSETQVSLALSKSSVTSTEMMDVGLFIDISRTSTGARASFASSRQSTTSRQTRAGQFARKTTRKPYILNLVKDGSETQDEPNGVHSRQVISVKEPDFSKLRVDDPDALGDYRALSDAIEWTAEKIPTQLLDMLNRLPQHYHHNPQMKHIFESMIEENTAEDEPTAPRIEINGEKNGPVCPPWEFYYTNRIFYGKGVPRSDRKLLKGCDCDGPCDPDSKTCACVQRQIAWTGDDKSIKGFLYNRKGRVYNPGYPIFECNDACGCSEECMNRVIQNGRQHHISICLTDGKGWGVYADEKVPRGTFIGIYAGEMLLESEAAQRGKLYDKYGRTYLFDLDFYYLHSLRANNQRMSPSKRRRTPTLSRGSPAWSDDERCINLYTIDAFHVGNFTRFMNHSCDPNCVITPSYVNEPDLQKPTLTIFTIRDVKKGEELCISYFGNDDDDDDDENQVDELGQNKKVVGGPGTHTATAIHRPCLCKASNCKGKMF